MQPQKSINPRHRLNSVHHFRGVAIFFIVAGHCLYASQWCIDTPGERVFANLVLGGTSLFVFISGFLFHHVYYQRQLFRYADFLKKKFSYVFLPYLAMSAYPVLELVYFPAAAAAHHPSIQYPVGNLAKILFLLGTGSHLFAYWYIPFIMIIFLLAPLFMRFIEMKARNRLAVTALLLGLAVLIHRPLNNVFLPQSVLYFTPVYLLGIISSQGYDSLRTLLPRSQPWLAGGALSLASLQAMVYNTYGNFHKEMLLLAGFDLMLPQKILLGFFFLSLLARFEATSLPGLDLLARVSFPVFFLHPFVLRLALKVQIVPDLPEVLSWTLLTLMVLLGSIGLAVLVKKLFPGRSRYLVGY